MGMTITEKILARHAGMDELKPGQIIEVNVDLMMMNDITERVQAERQLQWELGVNTALAALSQARSQATSLSR